MSFIRFIIVLCLMLGLLLTACGKKEVATDEVVASEMILIQGGTFQMGSERGSSDERPIRNVTLESFYLSNNLVTQTEWEEVMDYNPSNFSGEERPVENISWYEAIEYCNKRSELEDLEPVYSIDRESEDQLNLNTFDDLKWTISVNTNANGYRLPTEAEWEFAARSGINRSVTQYSGSDNVDEVAWYIGNSDNVTHNVGEKEPNSLGLYDMSGNVSEWCWDWYDDYEEEQIDNPTGATIGFERVSRGGAFDEAAYQQRTTFRGTGAPVQKEINRGLRVARNSL